MLTPALISVASAPSSELTVARATSPTRTAPTSRYAGATASAIVPPVPAYVNPRFDASATVDTIPSSP